MISAEVAIMTMATMQTWLLTPVSTDVHDENCDEDNKNCQDDGPDVDDDDHLDPPHLHLGHAAFCLKGVEVGGQGEHHIALSHTNLNISMVIVLRHDDNLQSLD